MGFVQLHIHNHVGSRLDGVGSPEQYAQRAKELGHHALACTDHGKLSAFYEHQIACQKYKIKPIFGVELYIADELVSLNEKKKRVRGTNYHLTVLAKNEVGYKNLLKLNYISMADTDHFYYVNRVTLQELFKYKEGLIVLSGCMNSPINKRIRNGKTEEARDIFENFIHEFGNDYYGEIQLNDLGEKPGSDDGTDQHICNSKILEWSKTYNVKVVITGDVHYLEEGENDVQTISIAIRNKQTIDEMNFTIDSTSLYYHGESDYIKFNEKFGYNYKNEDIIEWCNNTIEVADKCNYIIPERNKIHLPKVSEDDEALLINKAKKGLMGIFNVDDFKKIPEEYQQRLLKEIEIIIRKGFSSYLLILEDVFSFVDNNGYYRGPARGSAAGSLVCYSLGITTLDPIKYNLLFERFMSEARSVDMVYDYFQEGN